MTDRSPVLTSFRLFAITAFLVLPLACSSSGSSSGTGGSGGHATGGSAGTHAGGSAGHASGGANGGAGGAVGGAAGGSVGGGSGGSVGGAAGGVAGAAGGAAGHAPGGTAGHAPGGAAGGQAGGGAAGSAGGAGGAAGGASGAAGTGTAGSGGNAGAGGGGAGGTASLPTGNVIVNGDAEAAVGSVDALPVTTPGWTVTGEATAMQYGQAGYPASTDPGPTNRGANLFIGGYMDALSTLTQTIDLSAYATALDSGAVEAVLTGYFGGYAGQDDNAMLTATFENTSGQSLGQMISIGGVIAADRSDTTGLLLRTQQGLVPVGTRKVVIVLTLTRTEGTANDGYADNLGLTFQYL